MKVSSVARGSRIRVTRDETADEAAARAASAQEHVRRRARRLAFLARCTYLHQRALAGTLTAAETREAVRRLLVAVGIAPQEDDPE